MVTGDDHKSWQRKALEIMGFVDKSLGITSDISNLMHNHKVNNELFVPSVGSNDSYIIYGVKLCTRLVLYSIVLCSV